jgi:HAD superfamily hydrolase (TIGR01549 family)
MGISAALFDLDGTLRHSKPEGSAEIRRFAAESGLVISEERRRFADQWNHRYFASSEELAQDRKAAGDDRNAFWRQHARRFLLALGAEEAYLDALTSAVIHKMSTEYEWVDHVPDDVPPTLTKLKQLGLKLGLVSNRHDPLHEIVEELGLGECFDLTLAAGQVQSWKPNPQLLLSAIEQIGAKASECIYVGDNYYADVIGARAAGLEPILIDPHGTFPDADCLVIRRIGELPAILEGMQEG